ncbi:MAG TPA: hypothetical protein VGX48_26685 [Pyrinomonadaceae bacterium]|nr:hypothetical protein [Pyrinomonadaceae bacterium]
MRTRKRFYAAACALALALAPLPALAAAPGAFARQEQQQYGALERGYRTGYSDGYQSGWGDQSRRAPADFRNKDDYRRADRAYVASYGQLEDYRDGYRQGFEAGYRAGFGRAAFDSQLPAGGLSRRGAASNDTSDVNVVTDGIGPDRGGTPAPAVNRDDDEDDGNSSSSTPRGGSVNTSSVNPSETVLLVELLNRLSTDVSQVGDRFEARVVEPRDLEGAVISGTLAQIERPGKASGRALLQLQFDHIRLPGASAPTEFNGQVVEVLPGGAETGVGEVDPEGGVRGKDSTKDDVAKVGAAAGIGAIIGAIAGGGKGAAIGAVIGGGAATGGVMTQRGKDIRLEPGQQLRVRSSRPLR